MVRKMSSLQKKNSFDELKGITISEGMAISAQHAAVTCLRTEPTDRVVLIYDNSTREVAAALLGAFQQITNEIEAFNLDFFGQRPLSHPPRAILKALEQGTVSATAVAVMRGEITVRRAILGAVSASKLRHAHMPAISAEVFQDGLSVDYTEVAKFVAHLADVVSLTSSLSVRSPGGTDLELSYKDRASISCLDGIISSDSWQNLPSGQLIIEPLTADGVYVIDNVIGDWFEDHYDVANYPVSLEFEKGLVRQLTCDNPRLERDLSIFLRSSANSGRISELVVGANLGLRKHHGSILYKNYCPGVSISIGRLPGMSDTTAWNSKTFLPALGRHMTLFSGSKIILRDDTFVEDLFAE